MILSGTKLAHAGRGLGYKPSPWHPLDELAHGAKVGALPRVRVGTGTSDVDAAVVDILDQGAAPFCFANAPAQAIRTLQALNAAPAPSAVVPFPLPAPAPALGSRLWVVYLTHAIEGIPGVYDGGVISDAFSAIQKMGLPPESVWPYSDHNPGPFSTRPPAEVVRQAFDAIRPFHATRIVTEGDARVDDMRAALAARLPVVFGTQVTEDFCEGKLGPDFTVDTPQDQTLAGGHALMLSGDDGVSRFRVVNSWGDGWGDGGRCWFTYDYLRWVLTEDVWVVDFKGAQA
jgi:hypothetical protein